MSQFEEMNEMKAMYAAVSAQSFLLNQLYVTLFSADAEARMCIPESLVHAAMFRQHPPNAHIDEENMIDIHAHVVLNVVTFFKQVEARLQEETSPQVPA